MRLLLRLLLQPLCEVVPIVRCQGRHFSELLSCLSLSSAFPMKTGFLGPDLLAQGASEKKPAVGVVLPVCI